jgi:hypothetical protein
MLSGPDGYIDDQLQGIRTSLLDDSKPERTLEILRGSKWIRLLGELVAAGQPLTHEVLDQLPQGNPVNHLRIILVHTAALEPRDDDLEPLEPWLTNLLAGLPRQNGQLLRTYA